MENNKPVFFKSASALRAWLMKHHETASELIVGFYKVGSGKPSLTWSESVDEALCFGWIDGIRRTIDTISYTIRFTPRKPTSTWSAINIKKIEDLTARQLMMPAGIAAYERRQDNKSRIYSYENKPERLDGPLEKLFKANKKAWTFFTSMTPSYQKTAFYWVMSAKQEQTKRRRLEQLIADSAAGEKVKPLRYGS
ncbi:MAG TPA: YdeI/OmpD-associated family protein [Bacteroidota bacterium]|nr:YdeI/OmpD-associated family protein [Bacteroidota bacterium]